MAQLSEQKSVKGGLDLTLVAAGGAGDSYRNGGTQKLVVRNASGSSRTVTIQSQQPCSYGVTNDVHDIAIVIADGKTFTLGPYNTALFNDVNGYVQVTYSSNVGLTVGVLAN